MAPDYVAMDEFKTLYDFIIDILEEHEYRISNGQNYCHEGFYQIIAFTKDQAEYMDYMADLSFPPASEPLAIWVDPSKITVRTKEIERIFFLSSPNSIDSFTTFIKTRPDKDIEGE